MKRTCSAEAKAGAVRGAGDGAAGPWGGGRGTDPSVGHAKLLPRTLCPVVDDVLAEQVVVAKHDGGPQLGKRFLHPGQLVFKHLQAGHILLEAGEGDGVESLLLTGNLPQGQRGSIAPHFPPCIL